MIEALVRLYFTIGLVMAIFAFFSALSERHPYRLIRAPLFAACIAFVWPAVLFWVWWEERDG